MQRQPYAYLTATGTNAAECLDGVNELAAHLGPPEYRWQTGGGGRWKIEDIRYEVDNIARSAEGEIHVVEFIAYATLEWCPDWA